MYILPGLFFLSGAFIALIYISIKIRERKENAAYRRFLPSLNGKNFFCYNNKEGAREVIERLLIPQLIPEVEVIFLNGRSPESAYDEKIISRMLYRLKNYSKFPHLVKIRDGEMIDTSINNEFYNAINQHKPFDDLLRKINVFFELKEVLTK